MASRESSWRSTPVGSIVPMSFTIPVTGRAPGGYTVYKVAFEVKVQLPHGEMVFNKFEVWKRFRDFQQLARQLEELHVRSGSPDMFPNLVKPSYFERFKEAVIDERRISAVAMLKFASCKDYLTQPLSQFTEGSVKVESMPFQQTPVQPTTTFIDKPKDTVPLSKMLKDSPQFSRATDDSNSNNNKLPMPTEGNKESEDEDTEDSGDDDTDDCVTTYQPEDKPDVKEIPSDVKETPSDMKEARVDLTGEGWWTEAMAATDDLDSLVDQLEGGVEGVSTLSAESGRKSRSPSPGRKKGPDYISQAGRLITAALRCEASCDYQEAFDLFKAGVDLLLNGVQTDGSKRRREIVSRKTAEYLQHAEALYQEHLSNTPTQQPTASKPHLLPDFKVVALINKVVLVESRHSGQRFAIKVLYKSLQAMTAAGKGRTTTNRAPGHCKYMVKLLHHYETPNHRIFLLLEYMRRGRLMDHVMAKRAQWNRLHEAVINPHPSSSLIIQQEQEDNVIGQQEQDNGGDNEMDDMLLELSRLAPPTSLPTDSLTSAESGDVPSSDGEDSLTLLRRRLEATTAEVVSLTVQPPTPTTGPGGVPPTQPTLPTGPGGVPPTQPTLPTEPGDIPSTLSTEPVTVPPRLSPAGSGCSTPRYSPGRASPASKVTTPRYSPGRASPVSKVDEWVARLEDHVREWAAHIILGIEYLHSHGIICRDLNPANILLTDSGKALLTYFGKWDFVEANSKFKLSQQLYTAPELGGLSDTTEACDWWSLGAILFEILTGQTLLSCHPDGVHSHLPLKLPVVLSPQALSLLTQLLTVDPRERLGSGVAGAEEVKAHVFFTSIDWTTL